VKKSEIKTHIYKTQHKDILMINNDNDDNNNNDSNNNNNFNNTRVKRYVYTFTDNKNTNTNYFKCNWLFLIQFNYLFIYVLS
jgi:hypothetical protein